MADGIFKNDGRQNYSDSTEKYSISQLYTLLYEILNNSIQIFSEDGKKI